MPAIPHERDKPEAIGFPKRDRSQETFMGWAADHFRDRFRYPLRRADQGGGFFYQPVEDAWQAWQAAEVYLAAESKHLRKLVDDMTRHTLQNLPPALVVFDPVKIEDRS